MISFLSAAGIAHELGEAQEFIVPVKADFHGFPGRPLGPVGVHKEFDAAVGLELDAKLGAGGEDDLDRHVSLHLVPDSRSAGRAWRR